MSVFCKALHDYFISRDPNPRSDTPELSGVSWPAMTPSARKYLRVDRNLTVLENLNEDRYKLWEELYPIQY